MAKFCRRCGTTIVQVGKVNGRGCLSAERRRSWLDGRRLPRWLRQPAELDRERDVENAVPNFYPRSCGPRRSPLALRMISLKPNNNISMPDTTSIAVIARTSSEAGAMSPNPSVVIVATL